MDEKRERLIFEAGFRSGQSLGLSASRYEADTQCDRDWITCRDAMDDAVLAEINGDDDGTS